MIIKMYLIKEAFVNNYYNLKNYIINIKYLLVIHKFFYCFNYDL